MISQIARATWLKLLQQVSLSRWRAVLPVFICIGYAWVPSSQFDFQLARQRTLNILDIPAALIGHPFSVTLMYFIGCSLLIGDILSRERALGTDIGLLIRLPSRTAWWVSHLATAASLCALYVVVSFVGMILGAALNGLQVSYHDSPEALWILANNRASALYLRAWSLPMFLFIPALAGYTSLMLTLLVTIVVTLCLFFRHAMAPLIIAVVLASASIFFNSALQTESLVLRLIDTSYILSYTKHIPGGIYAETMSQGPFLTACGMFYVLLSLVGIWQARRKDY